MSQHATDKELIEYSLRDLEEPFLGQFEEHLLVCEWCRSRLETVDQHVEALRAALREMEEGEASS